MHRSVATIDSPQFINLQPLDINPFMSKCEIKVLYIGANRNHSFISKEVATEMAKTLRGAPIVGYYRDTKEDFTDHGEKVIIDDEGVKFECQTVPYGIVDPAGEVWFQDFEDFNDLGQSQVRTYLMTTGYLWTGQFVESSLPIEEGRPQSMELNSQTLKGHWETSIQNGMDFFIINDAIFEKICILGEDVEPCFEGASVTAPNVSKNFTLDDNFKHTLYSMMQDLKNVLNGGGQQMGNLEETVVVNEPAAPEVDVPAAETEFEKIQDNVDEINSAENKDITEDTSAPDTDYAKADEEDKKDDDASEEDSSDDDTDKEDDDEEEKENAKKYELLEEEYNTLKTQFAELESQYQKLVEFKKQIDNQNKDALISEFYMLSDEDKKDVIQNKEKYTLDQIKAKLSVICFDKKINFTLNKEQEQTSNINNSSSVVYSINDSDSTLPDWVKAVKEQEQFC